TTGHCELIMSTNVVSLRNRIFSSLFMFCVFLLVLFIHGHFICVVFPPVLVFKSDVT
ncbi:hypothetical protein L9F63_020466, partial [Diploptera punctata]